MFLFVCQGELDPQEYQKIQEIIVYPDAVKRDTIKNSNSNKERDSLIFIKKYDTNRVVAVGVDIDNASGNKIVFHKSMYEVNKKNPYASLLDVGILSVDGAPSTAGVPTIDAPRDSSDEVALGPGGSRLPARDSEQSIPVSDSTVNPAEPAFVSTLNEILAGKYDNDSSKVMYIAEAAYKEAMSQGTVDHHQLNHH